MKIVHHLFTAKISGSRPNRAAREFHLLMCSSKVTIVSAKPACTIREALEADVPAILRCLAEAFAPYRTSYSVEAFLDTVLTEPTLKQRMKHMTVLVAVSESDHSIVGTVACNLVSPDEGHLRGMAILPSCQGAGVAQQLLQQAETELRARKCIQITLDTTEPLQRAMRFYERNGYRPSGHVSDFFGMPLFEYVKSLQVNP
jgi:putative acetyltransferase